MEEIDQIKAKFRAEIVDWLGDAYDEKREYGVSNPDYWQPEHVDELVEKLARHIVGGRRHGGPISR